MRMNFFKKYYLWIIFFLILVLHIFLRFYQLEAKSPFGWDQVNTAWAAKDIIVDHRVFLSGPDPKGGSTGLYIGPAYYYLAALFYFLTNLDPIASGLFAGTVSVITSLTLFYIVKKMFSFITAFIAIFIYSISSIGFDRTQWGVNLIPLVSILVFYALYRIIITKDERFLMLLAFSLGLAFQVHFTTIVFVPVIALLTIPFFPRTKKMIKYFLLSLPIFFIWLLPAIWTFLSNSNHYLSNSVTFSNTYNHGFHLRRFLQLANDAFIEFPSFQSLKFVRFIFLPAFFLIYYLKNHKRSSIIFFYLISLWILVPWIVLSLYSGEITNYYFSLSMPIALIILSYIITSLIELKKLFINFVIFIFGIYFSFVNISAFFKTNFPGLSGSRIHVKSMIKNGKMVPFVRGDPASYLYYIYTRKK